jgi:hypothetical protein
MGYEASLLILADDEYYLILKDTSYCCWKALQNDYKMPTQSMLYQRIHQ